MKLLDFIVCDDIRQEMSGKQTIVGVYSDLVLHLLEKSKTLPIKMKLGFFIRLKIENNDQIPDAFIIEFLSENATFEKFNGKFNPILSNTEYIVLTLIHGNFPIQKPGKISFKVTLRKREQNIWEFSPEYLMEIKLA